MDMESYEQVEVDTDTLKGKGGFLTDGQEVKVLTYNGKVIDLQLAPSVVMRVADTEPGLKGDTVSGASKSATLESGITINVPLFIEPGEKVKVDTRSGEYLGRQ
jgi:elongation factor P